jgi:hypothetical protein
VSRCSSSRFGRGGGGPSDSRLTTYLTLDLRLRQAMQAVLTHLRLIGSDESLPLFLDLDLGRGLTASPSVARLLDSPLISSTIAGTEDCRTLQANREEIADFDQGFVTMKMTFSAESNNGRSADVIEGSMPLLFLCCAHHSVTTSD